jgi:hypothetical protein
MSMQQRLRNERWHQEQYTTEERDYMNYRNEYNQYIQPFDDGDMYEDYDCYDYELFAVGEVY